MYLNCKTYYSFRYGTFSTTELVNHAAQAGIDTLAITNINNTCDAWDFVKQCNEKKIKPILGAEIRNGNEVLYILLAANRKGFQWINHFLSTYRIGKKKFPSATTDVHFFDDPEDGFVIYPFGKKNCKIYYSMSQ
jgi:DNA polymerase-3 subunit alpha